MDILRKYVEPLDSMIYITVVTDRVLKWILNVSIATRIVKGNKKAMVNKNLLAIMKKNLSLDITFMLLIICWKFC